ncbi:MAG: 2Fe-2S iron-sulfur cluster binding domain-containing protein [Gammaproteobacteria bacterium]|nr:2Fe-2S iron-sulfur cluster binding domain-containing protein [Gammaproteobacteria bacterium]
MEILVTDNDGSQHTLTADTGEILMEVIRDSDLGILGTCGGMASCGTCHIYVAKQWLAKTGERTEDEGYMLEAIADMVEVNDRSRLACQITLSKELAGIAVEVAPEI